MATKKRFAVIGPGGRGSGWARNLQKHEETDIVALCDINEGKIKRMAEGFGGIGYYTNADEMFKKEDLDAVVIATPHYLHAPFTVQAAENDCHVLCEKPMAINLQQADQMIIACRKNDVKLAIGFQHRFHIANSYVYDAARGAEGDKGVSLGRITDFTLIARHYRGDVYYLGSSPVDPATGVPAGPWRGRWLTEGGGILANQAIHDIDLFQYIVGPFHSLSAHAATIAREHALIEVEDTVAVTFTAKNGAVGRMIFSTSNKKASGNTMRIQGEYGYLEYKMPYVRVDTRYKDEEDWEVPFMAPKRHNLLENFLDAIDNDTEPMIPGEEGRKSVEVMRAIFKSIQEERTVYFPIKDTMTYPTLHNLSRDEPLNLDELFD
ncbi:MAG: Gfo/Idh/MocA family protein [Candidatus Hodarchaeota archaeon]